ncbi:DUF4178 domain-containing protein [Novosphingobium sp. 1949]|uniref:DUF4178 domain-containing protein n=1 Tax=Novosphingobium organovorum TaxID=2930092 RepID=A0ABT0BH02_9SPHN|nr:DUF4178 domain-containing protein [Novosphingobium organovorum]MCJ2184200.1 DUF4178 domain-containing protein [Novosphingobium organovorum]
MSAPHAPKAPRTLACPNCGGTLALEAAGLTVNLGCRYCGSLLDVSRPEVELIRKYNRARARFAIDLGQRGRLFGEDWAVIGAIKRKDQSDNWSEYLLYNPYVGYRWLVEYQGEWQFGTLLLDLPEGDDRAVTWRGERYTRQWSEQEAVTGTVTGEFYWRIANGDRARCLSFARGETVLSRESVEDEVTWTQLVPVEADEVRSAFAIDGRRMPRKPRPTPSSGFLRPAGMEADDLGPMLLVGLAAAILTLLVMVFIAGPVDRASSVIAAPYGMTREGIKVGSITVGRDHQFVRITARGREFDNRWVDLDYSLVDRASGQAVTGYGLVEHYSGRDSDGNWSEGNRRADTLLGGVARGTYDLYVDAGAHAWPVDLAVGPAPGWSLAEQIPVTITAEAGGLPWGNWITLLIFLFIPPGIIVWHRFRNS